MFDITSISTQRAFHCVLITLVTEFSQNTSSCFSEEIPVSLHLLFFKLLGRNVQEQVTYLHTLQY